MKKELDRIDIKIASTDHIQLGTSSGDTTIKIATDAKDLQFTQFNVSRRIFLSLLNFFTSSSCLLLN